jgi:DNA repair protein SbcC/Rad50
MIPISLSLEGVFSYKERTTISFQPLLEAHLFGIFGAVGSGKSSILETITYCIYGQLERMNKREGLKENLINLEATDAYIEFEFEALHEPGYYRVIVVGKRRKTVEFSRECFKKDGKEWLPVESSKLEQAIGLSYEHFTRTVIVPQGKFQEFLQLKDKDRTDMLQELFQLGRFDLSDRLGRLKSVAKDQVTRSETRITTLEEQLTDAPSDLSERLDKQREEKLLAAGQLKALEANIHLVKQWEESETRRGVLEQQRNQINLSLASSLVRHEALVQADLQINEQATHLEGWRRQIVQAGEYLSLAETRQTIPLLSAEIALKLEEVADQEAIIKQQEIELIELQKTLAPIREEVLPTDMLLERHKVAQGLKHSSATLVELTSRGQSANKEREEYLLKTEDKIRSTILQAGRETDPTQDMGAIIPQWIEVAEGERKAVEQSLETIERNAPLDALSAVLVHGDPCPLCGSEHHPAPHQPGEWVAKMEALKAKKSELNTHLEWLKKAWNIRETGREVIVSMDKSIQKLRGEFSVHRNAQAALKLSLEAWQIKEEDLASYLENQQKLTNRLDELNISERQLVVLIQRSKEQLQVMRESWMNLTARMEALQIKLDVEEARIPESDKQTWSLMSPPQIHQFIEGKEREVEQVETSLTESAKALEKANTAIHTLRHDLVRTEDELNLIEAQLSVKNVEFPLTIEVVRPVRMGWEQDKPVQAALLSRLEGDIRLTEKELLAQTKLLAELAVLQTEFNKQQIRMENIKILEGLFRGKKMVEFAATRFLRQIIHHANERFHKMTRHKLRMELEDNRIMVRDYYHGGALRSVKTLSGGQIFQASLALALSMAEQLKKYRSGSRDFFFLDEGFGTQDQESLLLVLDTLKALRLENRCVGIISHVESLRQEVGAYLNIVQDPVRGSLIKYSY